jgi:hypothetical protein
VVKVVEGVSDAPETDQPTLYSRSVNEAVLLSTKRCVRDAPYCVLCASA